MQEIEEDDDIEDVFSNTLEKVVNNEQQ